MEPLVLFTVTGGSIHKGTGGLRVSLFSCIVLQSVHHNPIVHAVFGVVNSTVAAGTTGFSWKKIAYLYLTLII